MIRDFLFMSGREIRQAGSSERRGVAGLLSGGVAVSAGRGGGLVIGLEYVMRQDRRQLFPDIRSNAGSQEFDRP